MDEGLSLRLHQLLRQQLPQAILVSIAICLSPHQSHPAAQGRWTLRPTAERQRCQRLTAQHQPVQLVRYSVEGFNGMHGLAGISRTVTGQLGEMLVTAH